MNELMTDRRGLLRFAGALVITFTITEPVRGAAVQRPEKSVSPGDVQGFLAFHSSGEVSVFAGKVDLGTGVQTALMQIVAEELDVPMDRIRYTQGDTASTPDQGTTSGSLSIEKGGMQLRHAAATARLALLTRAAGVLRVDPARLTIQNGVVQTPDARQVALGDTLVEGLAHRIDVVLGAWIGAGLAVGLGFLPLRRAGHDALLGAGPSRSSLE